MDFFHVLPPWITKFCSAFRAPQNHFLEPSDFSVLFFQGLGEIPYAVVIAGVWTPVKFSENFFEHKNSLLKYALNMLAGMRLRIQNALRLCLFLNVWDDLAMLLAGAFPGVTCHPRRGELEQVVFLPAIQQHQQEG